jgi:hypothetical protein
MLLTRAALLSFQGIIMWEAHHQKGETDLFARPYVHIHHTRHISASQTIPRLPR